PTCAPRRESRRGGSSWVRHSVLLPGCPIETRHIDGRADFWLVVRSERLGLGRLDGDDNKPSNPVVFRSVVVFSERYLRVDDNAIGKRLIQLVQARDAELAEIALRHSHGGFAEPDIVPDDPIDMIALHDDELEFVT